ncbi:triose-phosphate isomerase [Streptomyces flaveolus]|uniref:triose-phosphate isomerase n=1 Tax=Streptomyces flaveolus TaxID=67297 RepID=UPI00343F22B9
MQTSTPPLSCTSTKMNLGLRDTMEWLDKIVLPHAPALARVSFFACLPHPLLPLAQQRLRGTGLRVAAQNCCPDRGAFTGEVSADLLAETGCTHVMLGHAERRRLFHEDDALIGRKAVAAARAGLVPLLCVGEDRRLGTQDASRHVARQAAALAGLPADRRALVLYEPAWAIGSDEGASPEHAAEILRTLRSELGDERIGYLYGGAVLPGVYTALRRAAPWDGVALGRAAQDSALLAEVLDELLTGGSQ